MLTFSDDLVRFVFRDDVGDPPTIWWLRRLTDSQAAAMGANMARQRRISLESGRDPDSVETALAQKEVEHRTVTGQVDRVENYGEEGTIIGERVFQVISLMPVGNYQELSDAVLRTGSLGVHDRN